MDDVIIFIEVKIKCSNVSERCWQDIVVMCQAIEKVFVQKLASMPSEVTSIVLFSTVNFFFQMKTFTYNLKCILFHCTMDELCFASIFVLID